jgi:hypothetical protein
MSFTVCRTIVVLRVDGEAELLKKKLADLRAAARRSCSASGTWE